MTRDSRDALLLLNGEISHDAEVLAVAKRCGGVICSDGGARHAARLGLLPRFVIGDMDSLPQRLPRWPGTIYWCDFGSERSDFEKAVAFAAGMGVERLWVAGARGGRLDHELVNVALVERYSGALAIVLVGGGRACVLGKGKHELDVPRGKTFSLLALPPRAKVTLSGARYPLRGAALAPGSRALSNVSSGRPRLQIHSGRVWVVT